MVAWYKASRNCRLPEMLFAKIHTPEYHGQQLVADSSAAAVAAANDEVVVVVEQFVDEDVAAVAKEIQRCQAFATDFAEVGGNLVVLGVADEVDEARQSLYPRS